MNVMWLVQGGFLLWGGFMLLRMTYQPTVPDADLDESQRLMRKVNRPYWVYCAPLMFVGGAVMIFQTLVGGK